MFGLTLEIACHPRPLNPVETPAQRRDPLLRHLVLRQHLACRSPSRQPQSGDEHHILHPGGGCECRYGLPLICSPQRLRTTT